MYCLSICISMTKNLTLSSLHSNNNESHTSSLQTNQNSEIIIPKQNANSMKTPRPRPQPRRQNQPPPKQRRPSVIEIERAIGAGRFRDTDPRELEEDRKTVYDASLMNFTGKYELPIMKKLRETGEWVTDQTERKVRASGKYILVFTFKWIMPIWILSFLVASGVIKLPFSSPFLDELIM